jgi:hypothetical protein
MILPLSFEDRRISPTPGLLRIPASVSASFHDNGAVFLDKDRGSVFVSNATGALILQGFLNGESVQCIATRLSGHFGIEQCQSERDTAEFLEQMRLEGLLEPVGRN